RGVLLGPSMSAPIVLAVVLSIVAAPGGKLAVDFEKSGKGAEWFVPALEAMFEREIGRFHHVQLVEKIDPRTCPTRDERCLIDAYRNAGIAVVILGSVHGKRLQYRVFETSTHTSAIEGSLLVDGVTRTTLERRIGDVVRPTVQRGGFLDRGELV